MSTKLDRLLGSIAPSRTLDKVSVDVDQAVNTFSMKSATINNWDQYQKFLADFCQHVERTVLRLGSRVPKNREFYWSRCSNILNKEFGPSGSKTAFEIVRTGKGDGLYGILKTIADEMAEDYAQKEISARIWNYLGRLTINQKLAAADEYLRKYGHLLPSEFKGANAVMLKMHFPKVLEEHPKIIRRMRRVGR